MCSLIEFSSTPVRKKGAKGAIAPPPAENAPNFCEIRDNFGLFQGRF